MAADGTGGTTTGPTVLDGLDSNKKINLEDYYSIQGQLGKGGQGTVYLAQVKDNQEFVALKKLAHSKMSRHAFRQLKAEVSAMEELKSVPNIIKIKYVHWRASQMKTQGRVPVSLIASEVARGHLMNYMRQLGAFDEDITRHFARQLLNGLKACHTKGIYHRDLKPENLLLSSDFDLLITDFGLAAMMDAKAATHLCVTPCGTRSYKPPEVRDAEGAARDGRAAYDPEKYDVWSAVIVIFIMFAGFAPLKEASSADWWFARLAERNYGKFWEAHNQFIPGHTFPRAFMDLVEAGLHVDPAKRATVDDLLAAEWMQGATVDPKVVQADMRRRYDAFTKPLVRDVAASSNPAEIDLLGGGVTRGDGADPAPPLPAPTAGVSWLATHANWSFVSGHSDDVMGDVTAALASWPAGVVDVTHDDSTPASALLTFPGGAVLGLQLYSQPDAAGVLVCSVCVPDDSAGEEAGASWDLDAELEGDGKEEEKEAEHTDGVPAWTDLEGLATEVSVFLAGQLVSPDATAGEAAGKLVATGGTGAHLAVPPSPPSA